MPSVKKARKPRASQRAATSTVSTLTLVERSASVIDPVASLNQAIRCRAYSYFEQRGCEHGRDFDDWIRAEAEVLAQFGAGPA